MPARQPRVPWAPLWAYAADRGCAGIGDLARQCGQDVRDLHRWRREGAIPERAADRVAVALGVVPDLIWGEAWAEATAALVERAEAQGAAKRAKVLARRRRLYKTNPAVRARTLAQNRAYKQASRQAQLVKNAAYRDANREKLRAARRARYQQNADAERARQREYDRRRSAEKRAS